MSSHEKISSHIIISDDIENRHIELLSLLQPYRVVSFIKDDFLVEDAHKVIAESYISEESTKYIILGAKSFNTISQNALLKVLEEPPRNIEYIIITPSKSSLLPTVRSRLSIKSYKNQLVKKELTISLINLDLKMVFEFVKEHERLKSHEAKELIELLMYRAVMIDQITLSKKQSEAFELAYRLINLNGNTRAILSMLLMSFLKK